jgi:hypothetical protein
LKARFLSKEEALEFKSKNQKIVFDGITGFFYLE